MTKTGDYIHSLIEREKKQEWTKPCLEMVKLRELLDSAGIGWHDMTARQRNGSIHRTVSDDYVVVDGREVRAFVVTWGLFCEGAEDGLLEVWPWDADEPTGRCSAADAYELCVEAVERAKERQ